MQLSKAKQKYVRSLHQKKYRQKYNKFLAEGDKIVRELLRQDRAGTDLILGLESWIQDNPDLAGVAADRIAIVDEPTLKSISTLSAPNQVIAVAGIPEDVPEWASIRGELALYLDGIRDPGNLGAILRVADWFGINWVFCSPDTVEVFNPKVVQASMGAVLRVKTATLEPERIFELADGWPILCALLEGENVYQADLPKKGLLLIGNESAGLRPELAERADLKLTIPRHSRGGAESLNAAVATGILCALLRRDGRQS